MRVQDVSPPRVHVFSAVSNQRLAAFIGIHRASPGVRELELIEPTFGIKFHCNVNLLQPVRVTTRAPGEVYRVVKANWGIWWDRRKDDGTCISALAFTMALGNPQAPSGAATIVLCPWFVDVFRRQRDAHPETVLGWIGDRIIRGLQHTPVLHGRKVIDLYVFPYATIVHEVRSFCSGSYIVRLILT